MFNEVKLLQENGVTKVHFYNVKTPLNDNTFTVCVLYNGKENRIEARGVSICSMMESFSSLKGRQKSFGRAIKSLKRKENFYKINGKGRQDEFVQREMKIKTQEDVDKFNSEIFPELMSIDPHCEIKANESLGKYKKKYIFRVPLSYPVEMANKRFKYKAQYRPTPVGEVEINLLKTPSKIEEQQHL